jgi:D-alanyl-D-alanine carboxypeptidase
MSGNGQLTPEELTLVQGPIQLSTSTARAWAVMLKAAADAGFTLWIATPAGGYRSLAVQQDMHARPWAYNLANNGVTLAPVGSSTHGYGTRIDMMPTWGKAFDWILANAARFGFTREFGAADPNHFKHTATTSAGNGTATPIPFEEPDMKPRILPITEALTGTTNGQTIWFDGPSGIIPVRTPTDLALLQRYIKTFDTPTIPDRMFAAEVAIIATYTQPRPTITIEQIIAALAADDDFTDADAARIAGLITTQPPAPHQFTPAELEQLGVVVAGSLADDFDQVNANIKDIPAAPTPGQIADERDARERKRLGL